MQLICLNTWSGIKRIELMQFLQRYAYVDIFCFQEVYRNAYRHLAPQERKKYAANLFDDVAVTLGLHVGYFRPSIGNYYGLASFVRSDITVSEEGDFWIYQNGRWQGGADHSRNLQYLRCNAGVGPFVICNTHGLWDAGGKGDTVDRLDQAEAIISFVGQRPEPTILCGDLNLRPDTESIAKLERHMKNLIVEFGISSTRTPLYPRAERFADYVFASAGIVVQEFRILQDEISDHSPLLLSFDVTSRNVP
jgi:endonuclease/exonuclease/phosphatase family metal-dependent hydrolase